MTIHHKFYVWKSYDFIFHVFVIFARGCCVSKTCMKHVWVGWRISINFYSKMDERLNGWNFFILLMHVLNKHHLCVKIMNVWITNFTWFPSSNRMMQNLWHDNYYNHHGKLIIHSSFFYWNKWNHYCMILPHMYIQHFNFMPCVTFLEKLGPFFHRKKEWVFVFHETQGHKVYWT